MYCVGKHEEQPSHTVLLNVEQGEITWLALGHWKQAEQPRSVVNVGALLW